MTSNDEKKYSNCDDMCQSKRSIYMSLSITPKRYIVVLKCVGVCEYHDSARSSFHPSGSKPFPYVSCLSRWDSKFHGAIGSFEYPFRTSFRSLDMNEIWVSQKMSLQSTPLRRPLTVALVEKPCPLVKTSVPTLRISLFTSACITEQRLRH